jgi:hypothetical protein
MKRKQRPCVSLKRHRCALESIIEGTTGAYLDAQRGVFQHTGSFLKQRKEFAPKCREYVFSRKPPPTWHNILKRHVYQKRWVSEHCEQCSTDVCVDEF